MKLLIDKEEFLLGLSRVQSIVEKKTALPILTNVLLETKTDALRIVATDLEIGIKGNYEAEIQEEGAIAIPARTLFNIVRELPEKQVSIVLEENNRVEIISGTAEFHLSVLGVEDFPILPDYEDEEFITLPAPFLFDMLEKVSHAIGVEETHPNLNGVFLQTDILDDKKILRLVSTDGHRLAVAEKTLPEGVALEVEKGVIVPRKGVIEIKKALEGVEESVDICFTDRNLILRLGTLLYIVRLIDGNFPDYKAVVPKDNDRFLTCSRDELYAVLRRVNLLSEESTIGVCFSFGKKVVHISCKNPTRGNADEEMAVSYDGKEFEIGFNARYLMDALAVVKDEDVHMAFSDRDNVPVLIKAPSDPGFSAVVMPMKI